MVYFSYQGRHYLVISSYQDNKDETNINSNMYQWDSVASRFKLISIHPKKNYIPTLLISQDIICLGVILRCTFYIFIRFSNQPVQQLQSHGARDMDITDISGVKFMAVANSGEFGEMYNPAT